MIKKSIILDKYDGNIPLIHNLIKVVTNYKGIFTHCILHGSYATDDAVKYSDFDGLLILKNSTGINEYSDALNDFFVNTNKIIYRLDPLQHHGWFIINESQLIDYPQTYFPFELYEHAKSLTGYDTEITLSLKDTYDYLTPFINSRNSIYKILNSHRPDNLYKLKGFLSEFMLIPCLYLQAKLQKGIFKKFSFEIAKKDFTQTDWEPIDCATHLRQIWDFKLNPLQDFLMTRPGKFYRKLTKHVLSPRLPLEYKYCLNDSFYYAVLSLLKLMSLKLECD